MAEIAMEIRTMGLYGNVRASHIWKGEGEDIEHFLPILFLGIGFFFCANKEKIVVRGKIL